MKISVIAPVFNVEEYVADCIESVMAQTHTDIELLLIDDGSTDISGAICDQYQEKNPHRIRTIHTENHGPLEARLIGIQEATGEVLVFVDSDDSIRADALEIISDCFQKNACDMVIYNSGTCPNYASAPTCHSFRDCRIFDESAMSELYRGLIRGDIPNSLWIKAVRTSCVSIPDHFRNRRIMHGEDLLLSACFLSGCRRVACINDGLYYYRIRSGSIVHTFNAGLKDALKTVHAEIGNYIDLWGMPELKPLHNARKVQGWVVNLKFLLKHRRSMDEKEVKRELNALAEDGYFRESYENMEPSELSRTDRIVARCLYRKRFFVLRTLYGLKKLVDKVH